MPVVYSGCPVNHWENGKTENLSGENEEEGSGYEIHWLMSICCMLESVFKLIRAAVIVVLRFSVEAWQSHTSMSFDDYFRTFHFITVYKLKLK